MGSAIGLLSFSYYLHEKAEESRHNECMSFMIAILGSVFLIGGMLQTFITAQRPQWFLIFPYQLGSSPYDFLGLALTILGITLFLAGIVLAVHYGGQRLWYSNALKESYRFEEEKLKAGRKAQDSPPLIQETTEEASSLAAFLESKSDSDRTIEQEA